MHFEPRFNSNQGALLAGVCSGIAQAFRWNVWVLRALFVGFLLLKTFWAVVSYAVLALLFHFHEEGWGRGRSQDDELVSPELSGRNERINDLERRFREMEERSTD